MAAPDTERPAQRTAEDYSYLEGTPALSSTGKDFKPSPLGRSVVTALEAQLEQVSSEPPLCPRYHLHGETPTITRPWPL